MTFNWRREPSNPYLPADGSLAQMYSNDMNGYRPLQLPVQKTPNELAADAAQSMAGYTRNNMDNYRPNIMGDQVPGGQQPAPDFEGYGESLQAASDAAAQAQAKEQQIANIQSQIKTLQARIAENQAKLKNWNGGDVANKIAALEARKFFSQDPTSIWRWKQEKDYATQLAAKQKETDNTAKANAMIEIANDLDSIIVDSSMTSQDQKAYLSKLSNLKTLGEKAGVPKSVIDNINAKISEVKGENKKVENESKNTEELDTSMYLDGSDRDKNNSAAERILSSDKPSVQELDKIIKGNVDRGLKNKAQNLRDATIKRNKQEETDAKKEQSLLGKKNLTSKEIQFMEGRKDVKKHSDDYGNIWFTRGSF